MSVTADARGVVSHAGSRLLVDVADLTTLTGEMPSRAGPMTLQQPPGTKSERAADMARL